MARERTPQDTTRAAAYALWLHAPNPMVTFFKTLDVTNLVRISAKNIGNAKNAGNIRDGGNGRNRLKFNMLLDWCIGKAAADIPEFYTLPVGEKLIQYDTLAVNTIVKNRDGGVSSCDILFSEKPEDFFRDYMKYTEQTAETCQDRDLSADSMVIGTSAVLETELDGVVGMNSGIFNNPFLFWGRYRRRWFRYYLPVSFQFHHTQMDGGHAGKFLENLQREIRQFHINAKK